MSLAMEQTMERWRAARPQSERLGELTQALEVEVRLIEELRHALARQRGGISSDDPVAVDASTQLIARTVLNLDEARRRRVTLTGYLTGGLSAELDALEGVFGGAVPETLVRARRAARVAAEAAAQDLAINQTILRRALDAGDAYLQELFTSAVEPTPVYLPGEASGDGPRASGLLVNRTA